MSNHPPASGKPTVKKGFIVPSITEASVSSIKRSQPKDSLIIHEAKHTKQLVIDNGPASKKRKVSHEATLSLSSSSSSGSGSRFHIVFLIDISKSMHMRDVRSKGRGEVSRISAVWDAVEGFSKLLMHHSDIITSVILFNDSAEVKFRAIPFPGRAGLMGKLSQLRAITPRFGGKYVPALRALHDLHQEFSTQVQVTTGVMLSDGRPGDRPEEAVRYAQTLAKEFGSKCLIHTVMFGPDAIHHAGCLEKMAKVGGGDFHANAELDASSLQRTFIRLSTCVSTMRSSVLAFGEKALTRTPQKQLEPEAAWTKAKTATEWNPSIMRKVKGYMRLPAKGGEEMDLQRYGTERVAYLHKKPFAEGTMRYASHLWWIALDGKAWHLVVKESKFEGAHETPQDVHGYFLKNHRRAEGFGMLFNSELASRARDLNVKVKFTPAYVVELSDPDGSDVRYLTAEKFIEGQYVKFNANDGWVNQAVEKDEEGQVAGAFSHFSFQQSDGDDICVDIQGVGFRWTDPQLHSRSRVYGAGDLGEEGIKLFFRSHTCNRFCKMLGLKLVNAEDLSMQAEKGRIQVDRECLVCLDKDRTVVNRPCGHLCICESCYNSQLSARETCIVCRKPVKSVLKLKASEAMHHSTYYKGKY